MHRPRSYRTGENAGLRREFYKDRRTKFYKVLHFDRFSVRLLGQITAITVYVQLIAIAYVYITKKYCLMMGLLCTVDIFCFWEIRKLIRLVFGDRYVHVSVLVL